MRKLSVIALALFLFILLSTLVYAQPSTGGGGGGGSGGSATNLAGGTANAVPYQSAPGVTTFLPQGTGVWYESAGAPFYTLTPALTSVNGISATSSVTIQGGADAASNSVLGGILLRGGSQTGTGSTNSAGGGIDVSGGNNAGTSGTSQAGSVELEAGESTAGGQQGLMILGYQMTEGVGTVTQWNLQCYTSASRMTVLDCPANPTDFVGVTDYHSGSATEVHIPPSESPINASAAVTLYHTVCAGATAGEVTDSGGTGPCPSGAGITVGKVIAVSGTWTLADGASFTASTTLPLVAMTSRSQVGAGDVSGTLSNNTNGNAANLSGTPALPNGTSATTQTAGDNTTAIATDAFVQTAVASADIRPTRTTSVEYITVAASGSYTLSTSPTGPGTMTYLHLDVWPSGDVANVLQNSTLTFACDGVSQVVDLGTFFLNMDNPVPFAANTIANLMGRISNGSTLNRRMEVNFASSCTVTFNNASSTSSVQLFGEASYKVGAWTSRPSRQYWHALAYPTTAITQYSAVNLLPTVTTSGGGELESVTLWGNSSANAGYLEADPVVTTDGSTAVTANGTEDFFGGGYYCGNGVGGQHVDKWGCFYASGIDSTGPSLQSPAASYDWLGYRFFNSNDGDNVLFTSTLAVASANGQSGQGTAPGTVNFRGLVTYWTNQPLSSSSLTLTSTNGTLSGTNCTSSSYASGTPVSCTAAGNSGYAFSSWTGTGSAAACSSANPCAFTLSANTTLTANYSTVTTYALTTATAGSGTGTVTGCAGNYASGAAYSCTVAASTGSTLSSVSGCGGSGTTTYAGTMPSSACTVTATFTLNTYSLTVGTSGGGSGTLSGTNCTSGTYNYGTSVSCTATATSGSFNGWTGTGSAASCSTGVCSFTLSATTTLTASFGVPQASTPSISSPVQGYYYVGGIATVTLMDGTSGSYICYTTTGVTPVPNGSGGCTTGTLYSAPFAVSSAETVEAVAGASGYIPSATASQAFAQSALVASWNMTDGSGTTASDSCCGDNLTLTNTTWTGATGPFTNAIALTGSSSYGTAANYTNMNFQYNSSFSIGAAFYVTNLSTGPVIFAKAATPNLQGFALGMVNSSPYYMNFIVYNNASTPLGFDQEFACTPTSSAWNTVVVTYNGNSLANGSSLYLNGTACTAGTVTVNNLSTNSIQSTTLPTVGALSGGTAGMAGKEAAVKVWNRVLTGTEAAAFNTNPYTTAIN